MKKLKKYNDKEIKALAVEYNALVNDMFQTDEAGLIYMFDREVIEDQNFVLPYMPIMKNETKSGQPDRLWLDWDTEETENKMIKKYNLKTPITAVIWTGDNIKEVADLTDNNVNWVDGKLELAYRTSEGYASSTLLEIGDFVFKGSDGEYDCTDASRFNELFKEI